MSKKNSTKKYLPVVLGIVIMVLDVSVVSAQLAEKHIQDLVAANHILAQQDVLDGYGHLSVRHPDNPNHILISEYYSLEIIIL